MGIEHLVSTLNVGYRTRISGETDFPCIYGEKVGLGRSYVKLDGKLDYDQWCEGIRKGRNYVSDGKSHLIDFKLNDASPRRKRQRTEIMPEPGNVKVSGQSRRPVERATEPSRAKTQLLGRQPYWDIERARVGETREVPVELIVNGYPVAKQNHCRLTAKCMR